MAVKDWSETAADNTGIISGMSLDGAVMTVNQTDNAFRDLAAQIASQLGKMGFEGADIASATTTDLSNATGWSLDITGTETITGFGTVDAGQVFILRFAGALTLTHNATSLILPGARNITTAANDVAIMKSEGSGNWRCISFSKANGILTMATTSTIKGVNTGIGSAYLTFTDSAGTRLGYVGAGSGVDDSVSLVADTGDLNLIADTIAFDSVEPITLSGGTTNLLVATNVVRVDADNAVQLGASGFRWSNIFSVNGNYSGTITETSDETLKTDWRDFSTGFVDRLATVKTGSFTRTDTGNREVGVGAQSLQSVLPECVVAADDGFLSVAYGKAALVACVQLAREIASLKAELGRS